MFIVRRFKETMNIEITIIIFLSILLIIAIGCMLESNNIIKEEVMKLKGEIRDLKTIIENKVK